MALQTFPLISVPVPNGFQYVGPTSFPQGSLMTPQYIQGLPLAPPHYGEPANVFMVENNAFSLPPPQGPIYYTADPSSTLVPAMYTNQCWQFAAVPPSSAVQDTFAFSSVASSPPGILTTSSPSHDFLPIPSKTQQPKAAPPQRQSEPTKLCFATSRLKKNNKPVIVPPPAPGDTSGEGPRQLIVNYLPQEVDSELLRELFEPYGPVEAARIARDPVTKCSRGFGFVYFRHHADALAAITHATGRVLRRKRVRVSYAIPQRPLESMLDECFM
jgi:hypothetical protein